MKKKTSLGRPVLMATALASAAASGFADDGAKRGNLVSEAEAPFLSNLVQLTEPSMGLFNAGEAYFSPDGRTIIFQATPTGKSDYQIYTMKLETRAVTMVSTGRGACTCAFFRPDGRKIIFAATHHAPADEQTKKPDESDGYQWSFDRHMDIYEADPDGSHLRRLTNAPGYDAEGSYSSDGRHIVFTSERDGDLEIYVMNADGSNQRRITNGKGYDGGPFFSADGKHILYRGDRRNDGEMNLQLRIVGSDGTDDRALTDNPIFNWCPYWHPSAKSFIFTQADHRGRPNYDLFMMTTDGQDMTRITFDAAFDGLPVFSPNAKRLMWTSKRGQLAEPQIFIADFTLPAKFR